MFSAKQFPFAGLHDSATMFSPLESQLANFQDLTQLLSEDIDRYTETCHQIWQNVADSIWQQQLDLWSGKPSDELMMNLSARLQSLFEQSNQAQACLHNIVDDAVKKATDLFAQSWQMPDQFSINTPFSQWSFAQTSSLLPSTARIIDITPDESTKPPAADSVKKVVQRKSKVQATTVSTKEPTKTFKRQASAPKAVKNKLH